MKDEEEEYIHEKSKEKKEKENSSALLFIHLTWLHEEPSIYNNTRNLWIS